MREYDDLANAIILQAIADYEYAYNRIKILADHDRLARKLSKLTDMRKGNLIKREQNEMRLCERTLAEVDRFFESEWCVELTKTNAAAHWKKKRAEIMGEI